MNAVIGGAGVDFTNPNWERRKMFAEAFSGKAHLYPETTGAIESAKRKGVDTLVMGYLQKVQPTSLPAELKKVKKNLYWLSLAIRIAITEMCLHWQK